MKRGCTLPSAASRSWERSCGALPTLREVEVAPQAPSLYLRVCEIGATWAPLKGSLHVLTGARRVGGEQPALPRPPPHLIQW